MNISRYFSPAAGLILAAALIVSFALVANATSKDDIIYPIRELGNCRDEAACRAYCDARDDVERARACIAVAKKHNLLPPDELEEAEHYVVRLGITQGPGGCRNDAECTAYCENVANLTECLAFAERYNLRTPEEIAEGRRVAAVLAGGGALPGGCRTKEACEAYCEDPSHMRACVAFAKQAGFISEEEAAEAEKIIPLIESGVQTPGNCNRKAACETYCLEPGHLDECLVFAERAGIMSPEELAEAKKFAPYIARGETPGQCKAKEACEDYCGDSAHIEECVNFAEKAGLISGEDAALAKKIGTAGGPGGCRSREECESFCQDAANQEECFNFAKEHGLTEEIAEVETKVRGEIEAKARACSQLPCKEMFACMQGLGGEGSQGGTAEDLPADVQGKLNACIEEEVRKQTEEAAGGGEHPAIPGQGPHPTGRLPYGSEQPQTQQEIERRTQEESQKQYQEEYKRQYDAEVQRQTEAATKAQVDCSLFSTAPTCEYAGPVGSDNYNYCKQCFPDK